MADEVQIDLGDYRTSAESKVFSGRPRGEYCRKLLNLDAYDREGRSLSIRIPPDVYGVNMSFFLGLFGPSVRFYKAAEFNRHYRFEASTHIMRVIPQYVEEALLDSISLPQRKTA
jgi:hypothetical protein